MSSRRRDHHRTLRPLTSAGLFRTAARASSRKISGRPIPSGVCRSPLFGRQSPEGVPQATATPANRRSGLVDDPGRRSRHIGLARRGIGDCAPQPWGLNIRVRVDWGNRDMRIGIVGSRRRTDRGTVEACITELTPDTVVVTGGARGPDHWAEQAARARGLGVVVHDPDLREVRARWQATRRYYARNQVIVDGSDRIIAFVAPERTGCSEDTIRRAVRAGKPVEVR